VDAGSFSAQPFREVYERTTSFTEGQQVIFDQYAVALAETSPSGGTGFLFFSG